MKEYGQDFWEACWQRGAGTDYATHLIKYYRRQNPIVDLLKQHHAHQICDAGCGYGAWSLVLASNGFDVEGFDISQASVELTKKLLAKYGIDALKYRVSSVLDTGYSTIFDAVVACSVLDHLYVKDAKSALNELLRIVRPGGIVVVSFDELDEDDLNHPHTVTADGSILYTDAAWGGMVFHHYSDEALKAWLNPYHILLNYQNNRGERFFAIQNQHHFANC